MKYGLCLILACYFFTSCITLNQTKTTQIEVMRPGIINFPENIKTVAIINSYSDNEEFKYLDRSIQTSEYSNPHESVFTEYDKSITYRYLTNTCVDALVQALKKEGYFKKVLNYRDSLAYLNQKEKAGINSEYLFKKTKADACIFLEKFNFDIEDLDRFEHVTNKVLLTWSIVHKMDTLSFTCNQRDTLYFEESDFPKEMPDNLKMKMVTNNSAIFLGKYFCSKILPSWNPVNRLYYSSGNYLMGRAEILLKNNDWLGAAKIWSKLTKSKNMELVAISTFNLALACEMEGKLDAATDWLIKSYSFNFKNSYVHRIRCQQYINTIAKRQKDIDRLNQQIRFETKSSSNN